MKKETKKEMTIEDLAMITQQGFSGLESRMMGRLDDFRKEVNTRFEEVNTRFEEVNDRFDRVEHILYRGHDNRIEKLEDKIAQIQVILGKKLA